MKKLVTAAFVLLLSACSTPPKTQNYEGADFAFALVGDTPYGEASVRKFDRVIDSINTDPEVDFVLHAGDIKSGSSPCDDDLISKRYQQYQKIEKAFIYTPGDNEWTDCHRPKAGAYNPLDRLNYLRKVFFAEPSQTTGQQPIPVSNQSAIPGFENYVENSLFQHKGVLVSSVHIVGSGNNLMPWHGIDDQDTIDTPRIERIEEFKSRLNAAIHWLEHSFTTAKANNANAIVILTHADFRFDLVPESKGRAGFNKIIDKLSALALDFNKPVLLAHGDFHRFTHDKPLASVPNLTRLESFGPKKQKWIKVHVNNDWEEVFRIEKRPTK